MCHASVKNRARVVHQGGGKEPFGCRNIKEAPDASPLSPSKAFPPSFDQPPPSLPQPCRLPLLIGVLSHTLLRSTPTPRLPPPLPWLSVFPPVGRHPILRSGVIQRPLARIDPNPIPTRPLLTSRSHYLGHPKCCWSKYIFDCEASWITSLAGAYLVLLGG